MLEYQWSITDFLVDQFAYIPLEQKSEDGFEAVKVKLMCQAVGCQKDQFSSSSSGIKITILRTYFFPKI